MKSAFLQEDASLSKEFRNSSRTGKHRSKFIPVNQHPLVICVRADLARHHLDRHADLHRLFTVTISTGMPICTDCSPRSVS